MPLVPPSPGTAGRDALGWAPCAQHRASEEQPSGGDTNGVNSGRGVEFPARVCRRVHVHSPVRAATERAGVSAECRCESHTSFHSSK